MSITVIFHPWKRSKDGANSVVTDYETKDPSKGVKRFQT
jgi:hypothetical protein